MRWSSEGGSPGLSKMKYHEFDLMLDISSTNHCAPLILALRLSLLEYNSNLITQIPVIRSGKTCPVLQAFGHLVREPIRDLIVGQSLISLMQVFSLVVYSIFPAYSWLFSS